MLNLFSKKKNPKKEHSVILEGYDPPSFPAAVMNVLSLLRDPESSIDEIAAQIEIDPGMQIKVLKTVNSAAFGLSSNVSNIRHATSLLGRSRLESIVLALAIKNTVPDTEVEGFSIQDFWLSAARRGSFSRAIAMRLHPATQIESFTGGFLQDMAVPVLASVKKDAYVEIYQKWLAEPASKLDELERETFGFDHPPVGALLAEEWDMPEYIVN